MSDDQLPVFDGSILTVATPISIGVQLDTGDIVSARIPARVAHKARNIVPGARVRVRDNGEGKYVVIGRGAPLKEQ